MKEQIKNNEKDKTYKIRLLREINNGLMDIKTVRKSSLEKYNIKQDGLVFSEPVGFFEFVSLEKNASLILTDSGTVSEEACILDVPCVTLREVTERQELIDCGSTILSTYSSNKILESSIKMLSSQSWLKPKEYLWNNVSEKVINKLLEE